MANSQLLNERLIPSISLLVCLPLPPSARIDGDGKLSISPYRTERAGDRSDRAVDRSNRSGDRSDRDGDRSDRAGDRSVSSENRSDRARDRYYRA